MTLKTVAIAGVTGAVGQEFLNLLESRNFPIKSLKVLASARSQGKTIKFKGETLPVEVLGKDSFKGIEIALFSAGGSRSLEFAPAAVASGAVVVDNSSAYRMDPEVPLVVPEINPEAIKKHKGIIANPNCSTIIMNVPVFPLFKKYGVKRLVISTYQAASGAGATAMRELQDETRFVLDGGKHADFKRTAYPNPYAFNVYAHNSKFDPLTRYCEEELKMVNETRKIFGKADIAVHATCVRVPTLRAHAESINIEFPVEVSVEDAYAMLSKAPGVKIFENPAANVWPTPLDASGQGLVLVGRIRKDLSQPNTLDMWVVGDQLLKGAALNAVQIAELL
ncbi:MAG: aspartate-semialdehyde dehydrogenase [Planctomycetota bacterium]